MPQVTKHYENETNFNDNQTKLTPMKSENCQRNEIFHLNLLQKIDINVSPEL